MPAVQLNLLSDFDKKSRKVRSKTIVQSNAITMSKKDWTLQENKMLYIILSQICEWRKLNNDRVDMASDLLITFDGKILLEADKHITRAVKTLKSLRERSIQIFDGRRYTVVGFINYADYDINTHQVKIQISHKVLPCFFGLAERFTQYALNTALECQSVYSQRLFELCAMFAQAGLFSLNLDEFRDIFNIEKYSSENGKYNLIKKSVKHPQNELFNLYNEKLSDLFFTFFEKQKNITFLVHQRNEPNRKSIEWAKLIGVLLSHILNYDQDCIGRILAKHSENNKANCDAAFNALFQEFVRVNIHIKPTIEKRKQMNQILFQNGIHPCQINAKT